MDTILAIPSEELLADARRIFGTNLVTGAWIADYCNRPKYEDVNTMSRLKDAYADADKYEIVLHDAGGLIMLEFCNSRRVCFSTSEWGHISLPDGEVQFVDYKPEQES